MELRPYGQTSASCDELTDVRSEILTSHGDRSVLQSLTASMFRAADSSERATSVQVVSPYCVTYPTSCESI